MWDDEKLAHRDFIRTTHQIDEIMDLKSLRAYGTLGPPASATIRWNRENRHTNKDDINVLDLETPANDLRTIKEQTVSRPRFGYEDNLRPGTFTQHRRLQWQKMHFRAAKKGARQLLWPS